MTYVSDATPPASGAGRDPHAPRRSARPTRAGLPTPEALTALLAETPLAGPQAAPPEPQDALAEPLAEAVVVPLAEVAVMPPAEAAVAPLAEAAVVPFAEAVAAPTRPLPAPTRPPVPEAPTAPRPAAPGPRLRPPFVDSPAAGTATPDTGAPGARRPDGGPGDRPRLGAVPLPEAPRAAARRRDLPTVRAVRLGGAPAEPRPAPGEAPAAPAAVTPVPLPLPRASGTAAVPNESRTEEPQP
ncbi:hypothetical protein [Streptomyces sp. NPDC004435]|uniref:hypothetical protein n=1 Tax=Streptomyces sp. NPDC004435 TaxID=3364701 RepID=UPI0036B20EB1